MNVTGVGINYSTRSNYVLQCMILFVIVIGKCRNKFNSIQFNSIKKGHHSSVFYQEDRVALLTLADDGVFY